MSDRPLTDKEVAQWFDPDNHPDRRRREGWWGMACWNALSETQQHALIDRGNLPIGYTPQGPCPNPADVAIETRHDTAPGPRFYCRPCAAAHLQT